MYSKLVDIALIVHEISWVEYGNVNLTTLHRPNTNFWIGIDQESVDWKRTRKELQIKKRRSSTLRLFCK